MRATRLRTEYLTEPLGLGIPHPRFSWNCAGGIRQTAYRIIATRRGDAVWDSGTVPSAQMTNIRYDGAELCSRDRIDWTVTLWDENGETEAEDRPTASWFELGLLDESDWSARWIAGDYTPERDMRYAVDHFRKRFTASAPVRRARLYITACGVYEASMNGTRVGEFRLAPGSTDYRHRLQYQAYDVTPLLTTDNTLEVRLADGWYRGSLGAFGQTKVFGDQTKLLCRLEIEHHDGTTTTIVSDNTFEWCNDGPIRFADLQDGEVIDARMAPSYGGRARVTGPALAPTASDNVQPRTKETFTPTLLVTPSDARVLDFGQNIAGFVGFTVHARSGQRIRLRLGEMLDEHGEFTQANFQEHKPVTDFGPEAELLLVTGRRAEIPGELQATPRQQVEYICADGENHYATEFAVFGFRYALIETDVQIDPSDFHAIAVYSDMTPTGEFECSNQDVNRLLENTRWSMKGNFLDVPTDCPTRERLGWTGDAQVFFDTAAYLFDVAPFFRKWLRDVHDDQTEAGTISAVVPYSGIPMMYDATGGSVGWADAIVLLPYRFWRRYGDESIIRESYPMMRAYARFLIGRTGHIDPEAARTDPFNEYVYEKGLHLGEWLEPEEFRDNVAGDPRVARPEEATAYLHYTMRHLTEIARTLDETEDAELFGRYADGSKEAYSHLFVPTGSIDTDRQAKLVRPLALGLVEGEARTRVQERLVQAVANRDYRVGTGFLSTPFLLPSLTAAGRTDVAYRMLENEQSPSWLAEVRAGATTVWEDWEGKASRNHYSPGAVCQWLFDTVAGIRVVGENRFMVAPHPGGTLTYASASYLSPYGVVSSAWQQSASELHVSVTVPPNTAATIVLPNGERHDVGAGTHEYAA